MDRTVRLSKTGTQIQQREWAPRVWEGCDYFAWLRMLTRARFSVQLRYWYIAFIVSIVTFFQTVLRWFQYGLYADRISQTKLTESPIFVLGHWRTGTTLLHELLILDSRHTSPTTLQCFVPCQFLLSEHFFKLYANWLLPDKRPMDNMAAGWDRPQEEEFALALLGMPSNYTDFAFPKNPPLYPGALDLSGLSASQKRTWKYTLFRFLQAVTMRDPRRLVIKSPPHTARIPVLLEMFPDAKFVHISRNPYELFASTVNLWLSMTRQHGFQKPERTPQLEEKVFREFRLIHETYEATKSLIPDGNLVEVRYEEVVKDQVAAIQSIYAGLGLGHFEAVRPALEARVAASQGYQTNKWQLSDEEKAKIQAQWGDIITSLGYAE